MRRSRRLHIVPEPPAGTASITRSQANVPFMVSDGNADYGCGNCGTVLLQAVTATQVQRQATIIQCGRCRAYNRAGALPGPRWPRPAQS